MSDDNNKDLDGMPIEAMSDAQDRTDDAIDPACESLSDATIQASNPEYDVVDAINHLDTSFPEAGPDTFGGFFSSRANVAAATIGVLGVTVVAVPSLVALPVLGLGGFGALGPIAGSIAAGAQSAMGSVVAPSLFATLQSAAMGGYGAAAVLGTFQAVGGITAASSAAYLARSNSDTAQQDQPPESEDPNTTEQEEPLDT
ncbi:hypothetical protein MCOR25_003071 [Pyricularia grisea]|nr:hypothetical protein MCOR25_003071 [Pyricularia grisea]